MISIRASLMVEALSCHKIGEGATGRARINHDPYYRYLLENQQRVVDVTLAAIAEDTPEQRRIFAQFYAPEVLDQLIPVALATEQMKTRVRLETIKIDFREKDGVAYIEYGFSCAWDCEHHLMVVLHNDRKVYFGGTGDGWRDRDGGAVAG